MKKVLFMFTFALCFSLLSTGVSFASVKSHKDGINQAGGCREKRFPYKYSSNGKTLHGALYVGLCVNEHYSAFYDNYVIQTDVYTREIGDPATCTIDLYLDGLNPSNKFTWLQDSKTLQCPNRRGFRNYDLGLSIQRYSNPNDRSSNSLNDRFFAKASTYIYQPGVIDPISAPDEFIGPSLTMK